MSFILIWYSAPLASQGKLGSVPPIERVRMETEEFATESEAATRIRELWLQGAHDVALKLPGGEMVTGTNLTVRVHDRADAH
jgi:hypothetical protein